MESLEIEKAQMGFGWLQLGILLESLETVMEPMDFEWDLLVWLWVRLAIEMEEREKQRELLEIEKE